MILLIPAYEPDDRLLALVSSIHCAAPDLHVLIVDDGSGPAYRDLFAEALALGCTVIGYPVNRGKGHALKAGFGHIALRWPREDVVCADCDGQHDVLDVLRVADRVRTAPVCRPTMVLGARRFAGPVPTRSRFGNSVTGLLFRLATKLPVHDTQTGLRGYPASMLNWLQTVDGERFEYELNLLLLAADAGYAIEEVEIATIYLAGNASSHFRPVADSLRIYAPLVRFSLSSLGAFALDTVALLALNALTETLLWSVLGARVLSSTVNFLTNRRLVFAGGTDKPIGIAAAQYWFLVTALLVANYGLLAGLTGVGLALLPAKVLTEVLLVAVSYQVQCRFVFVGPAPLAGGGDVVHTVEHAQAA